MQSTGKHINARREARPTDSSRFCQSSDISPAGSCISIAADTDAAAGSNLAGAGALLSATDSRFSVFAGCGAGRLLVTGVGAVPERNCCSWEITVSMLTALRA